MAVNGSNPDTHIGTKITLTFTTPLSTNDVVHKSKPESQNCPAKPIIIKCGDEEFLVPRQVLCKCSKMLEMMSKKISADQDWELSMTNVSRSTMTKLVDYITTHNPNLLRGVTDKTMFSLISLAHGMEMTSVETDLFSLILKKRNSYSIIAYLWDLAQKYHNDAAVQAIVRFTKTHINDMITKGFFKAITWEQVCVLVKSFGKDVPLDNLCIALIQWLKVDTSKHLHASILACHLDWNRLSNDIMCQLIFTEPLFRRILRHSLINKAWNPPIVVKSALMKYKQCQPQILVDKGPVSPSIETNCLFNKLMSYASAWMRNLPDEQLMNSPKSLAFVTKAVKRPAFLLLGTTRNNSIAMEVYFMESRAWAAPVDINMQQRCDFGCAYNKKNLYILGGDRGNGLIYESCYAFNVFNNKLSELTDLHHPRCHCGVAVSGNDLYLIGGLTQYKEAVSVALNLCLMEGCQIWKPLKNMKEKRYDAGVTVDRYGQVVVIGGHCCSCQYYNKHGWVDMESLPDCYRSYGMLATYSNQQVYAFRDFNPNEICIFDMTRTGLKIKPTNGPHPERIASLCCYGNELWVVTPEGGFYTFNLTTYHWKKTALKSKNFIRYLYLTLLEEADVRALEDNLNKPAETKHQEIKHHESNHKETKEN